MSRAEWFIEAFGFAAVLAAVGVVMSASGAIPYEFTIARVLFILGYSIVLYGIVRLVEDRDSSTAVFLGVGGIVIVIVLWVFSFQWIFDRAEIARKQPTFPSTKEIVAEERGGDNFCYFGALRNGTKTTDGPFQLSLTATGLLKNVTYWIAPGSAKPVDDPAYYSVDNVNDPRRHIPRLRMGTGAFDRSLPAGEYSIGFVADNEPWSQYLRIYIDDKGQLQHEIRVTRKGKQIYP
jgi:hypothetical protein